jgi:hypothetical protein
VAGFEGFELRPAREGKGEFVSIEDLEYDNFMVVVPEEDEGFD